MSAVIFGALAAGVPVQAVTSRVGSAQDLGIGTELGQPIGVTAKYWLNPTLAVDGAMGYHFNHNFDMHSDVLWHSFSSFDVSFPTRHDFIRHGVPFDRIDAEAAIAACSKAVEGNAKTGRFLFNLGQAYHKFGITPGRDGPVHLRT